MHTIKGLKYSQKFNQQKVAITCAASRVLTKSKGYKVEAAVIPDKPPLTKCTKTSLLAFALWFSPRTECNSWKKEKKKNDYEIDSNLRNISTKLWATHTLCKEHPSLHSCSIHKYRNWLQNKGDDELLSLNCLSKML